MSFTPEPAMFEERHVSLFRLLALLATLPIEEALPDVEDMPLTDESIF